MKYRALAAVTAGLCLAAVSVAGAHADTFNGRIAFSSFRTDPLGQVGDIFSMNDDGTDLRQLTDNPLDDAQSDWSPDGRDIAYRIRKPETPTVNFEVARMTAVRDGPPAVDVHAARTGVEPAHMVPGQERDPVSLERATRLQHLADGPLGESPVLRYDPTPGAPVVSEPRHPT